VKEEEDAGAGRVGLICIVVAVRVLGLSMLRSLMYVMLWVIGLANWYVWVGNYDVGHWKLEVRPKLKSKKDLIWVRFANRKNG